MKALEKSSVLQDSSPQEMNVGRPYPLRPTVTREGTNFSVFFAKEPLKNSPSGVQRE